MAIKFLNTVQVDTDVLYVDTANDRVGIGTTSPSAKLDINDDVQIDTYSAGTTVAHNAGYIKLLSDAKTGWAPGDELGKIEFYNKDTSGIGARNAASIRAVNNRGNGTSTATFEGELAFYTSAYNAAEAEAVRIDNTGNVGIGTTSPSAKLEVNGALFVGDHTGSVTPTDGIWIEGADGDETQIQMYSLNGSVFSVKNAATKATIGYGSSGDRSVNFTNSGAGGISVGIGTDNPSAKLDIYGDSNGADNMVELINSKYNSTNTTGETGILFGWNNHVAARIAAFKEGTTNRTGFKIVGEAGFNVPSLIATFRSTGAVQFNNYGAGTLVTDASGNITVSSGGGAGGPYLPLAGGTMAGQVIMGDASGSFSHELKFSNNTYQAGIDFQNSGELRFIDRSGSRKSITFNLLNGSIEAKNTGNTVTNFISTSGNSYFNGGNVGIGTNNPAGKLDIFRTSTTYAVNIGNTLDRAGLVIKSSGSFDSKLTFSSGANSVQYIQALNNAATTGRDININPYGGNVITAGTMTATNFILSSDERLKENIEEVCDNRIKADWKTFELKTERGQKRYGVIAQELEKTNPEFVREDTQGFKSVAYIDLLIAKIAELEARLEKAGI